MIQITKISRDLSLIVMFVAAASCGGESGSETSEPVVEATSPRMEAPRAINIGGSEVTAADGTMFAAEAFVSGGTVARTDAIKGSQNPGLFRECRTGDVNIDLPLADGTYDVTFFFSEPDEIGGRERLFNVLAEGETVIDELDVMAFRDGKIRSGLTITTPDVTVNDGELTVRFAAAVNEPVICAVLVRDKMPRSDDWQLTWNDEFDGAGSIRTNGISRSGSRAASTTKIRPTRRATRTCASRTAC